MIKLIIFDLDDTLYPEIEFVKSGFRIVSERIEKDFSIDKDYIFHKLWEEFIRDRKFVFNRVLRNIGLYNEEYLNELITLYRTHRPLISLYDDAKTILPILRDKFYLGIITDGYPTTQRLKVESLGIEKYFKKIIYTWEEGEYYSKPSSKAFVDMLNYFSCTSKQAVYIGDNIEKDFKGPKEIGMLTVKILRDDGIYRDLSPPDENYLPDFIINSLFDLFKFKFIKL